VLELRNVSVCYDATLVLHRVCLNIAINEIVALVGPSGSGKSTLLRVIAGIITPDTGDVIVDGETVTSWPTHRRSIGFVFQDEQLFPHRNVAGNIEYGLRIAHWSRSRRRQRVNELLTLVGLAGFEQRSVSDLSGGEAKRVALARTLAPSPRIVLLDEPLTGLDSELHDELAVQLATVLRASGTTALLVTHDRTEAASIADRIVSLDQLSDG
jgi:thiamine transport system ATP-binding protein